MTSNPAFTERNIQKPNDYLLDSRPEQKSLVTYHTLRSLYVCVWLVITLTSAAPIGSPIICMWSPADICEQWERNLSFALQLHADLSVYPKFWDHQVFIYSGYCSCHCRLPSEESTSGIPLILGAICLFCFEFCCLIDFLIAIVTWWVFNVSIKILGLAF